MTESFNQTVPATCTVGSPDYPMSVEREGQFEASFRPTMLTRNRVAVRSEASERAHYERQQRSKSRELEKLIQEQMRPGSGFIWHPQTTKARSPKLSKKRRNQASLQVVSSKQVSVKSKSPTGSFAARIQHPKHIIETKQSLRFVATKPSPMHTAAKM